MRVIHLVQIHCQSSHLVYPATRTKLRPTSVAMAPLATPAHHTLTLLRAPTQECSVPETHWTHITYQQEPTQLSMFKNVRFCIVCNSKVLTAICGTDCQPPPQSLLSCFFIIKTLIFSWANCHPAKHTHTHFSAFLRANLGYRTKFWSMRKRHTLLLHILSFNAWNSDVSLGLLQPHRTMRRRTCQHSELARAWVFTSITELPQQYMPLAFIFMREK